MSTSLIPQALTTATDTKRILIGPGVVHQTGALVRELFPDEKISIIADENTFQAAGKQTLASLEAAGVELATPLIFPARPIVYADYDSVSIVRQHLEALPGVIGLAIGSGTLNDLVKLASGELDRRYLVVGTAASMDGYTAFGASISKDGFKQTINCPAPLAVVTDIDILRLAPERLTATGYGDLIEKITAGADWILANELGIEAIDTEVWQLVQGPLLDSLAEPQAARDGEPTAITALTEGLLMSGLAMQSYQTSRPASGAGHQFSHLWEMYGIGLDHVPPLSHGFKVGLGTIAIAALYEELFATDLSGIDPKERSQNWPTKEQVTARIVAELPEHLHEASIKHSLDKYISGSALEQRITLTLSLWPELKQKLRAQLPPAEELREKLRVVGALTHPEQIGMTLDDFKQTYFTAGMIRNRYTMLDLLAELGLLETLVDRLFAPEGFWGRTIA